MTDKEFDEYFESLTSRELFNFLADRCSFISFNKVNDGIESNYRIRNRGDLLSAIEMEMLKSLEEVEG